MFSFRSGHIIVHNARNEKRIRLNIFIIGYQFCFCFHDFPIEFRNTSYGVILDFILFTMHLFYFIIIIIIITLASKINFCQFLFLGKPCIISDYEIKGRFTVTNLIMYHKWPAKLEYNIEVRRHCNLRKQSFDFCKARKE